ncbi:hypothetical protein [Cellulomonas sp. URHE0023]|uniref:hypothetical protein n=1 Tax=Cellulomonas sp. URHE0023 TaxID=1380354 RepID=UPI00047FD7E9|nr:hypothetical protein [Cellulomonas sp. URHE0023]
MWFLVFRRLRLILVAVLVLPLVATIARRLAVRAERRQDGPTLGSRGLRVVETSANRARSLLR